MCIILKDTSLTLLLRKYLLYIFKIHYLRLLSEKLLHIEVSIGPEE